MIYGLVIDVCYRPLLGIYCFLSRLIEFVQTNYMIYYVTNAVYYAVLAHYEMCLDIHCMTLKRIEIGK